MYLHLRAFRESPIALDTSQTPVPGNKRENLPMSKEIDSSWDTFVPFVVPRFPGEMQIRLVTFKWETSTPFGLPVVPFQG